MKKFFKTAITLSLVAAITLAAVFLYRFDSLSKASAVDFDAFPQSGPVTTISDSTGNVVFQSEKYTELNNIPPKSRKRFFGNRGQAVLFARRFGL